MAGEARTPEELETLFEDAVVLRSVAEVGRLFLRHGVLLTADGELARGRGEIVALVARRWRRGETYVAEVSEVLQAGDLALVRSGAGVAVVHRGHRRGWRYAIARIRFEGPLNADGYGRAAAGSVGAAGKGPPLIGCSAATRRSLSRTRGS
jgi:hypothetical protein